ncbi:MAG: nucleotidyl transferase AbiEii/AbiGii toxin family protein [Candidatus Omnitrophica bacterium]|nr:nucleotidyl transferase AbiEii/AbiGii toxin family protein [Candidatus Omnitrophota bacterium]
MLSLEYLLEEAKSNGLPILKRRGILREYLQVVILNSIYKHKFGRLMFFTGGTALRFFYNMPRFSEDLDFDTKRLSFGEFKEIIEKGVGKGLSQEGLNYKIYLEKRNRLFTAELNFPDLMKVYNLTDNRGMDLMIKVEVYKPQWDLESESQVLSLYGYNLSCVLLSQGNLLSEKLGALFNRKRGRDVYDSLFMLKKKFPFNKNVLQANNIKDEPKDAILRYLSNLKLKELKLLANQVRPFLFREDEIDLILKAPLYAERFLMGYPSD